MEKYDVYKKLIPIFQCPIQPFLLIIYQTKLIFLNKNMDFLHHIHQITVCRAFKDLCSHHDSSCPVMTLYNFHNQLFLLSTGCCCKTSNICDVFFIHDNAIIFTVYQINVSFLIT